MKNFPSYPYDREETIVSRPAITVTTKLSRWKNYEIVSNGSYYIRGFNNDSAETDIFSFADVNDSDILSDLLLISKELKVRPYHNQKKIDQEITEDDLMLLLRFCMKHGLPFWGNCPKVNPCINGDDDAMRDVATATMIHEVIPIGTKNICHVASFVQAINWLYRDFRQVCASNQWGYDDNATQLLHDDDMIMDDDDEMIVLNDLRDNPRELILPNRNPYITFWNNKKMCLQLNCENPFHLASYYICVARDSKQFKGGYVRICQKCGRYFVANRKNKKYCGNKGCNPASYHANKKRHNKT